MHSHWLLTSTSCQWQSWLEETYASKEIYLVNSSDRAMHLVTSSFLLLVMPSSKKMRQISPKCPNRRHVRRVFLQDQLPGMLLEETADGWETAGRQLGQGSVGLWRSNFFFHAELVGSDRSLFASCVSFHVVCDLLWYFIHMFVVHAGNFMGSFLSPSEVVNHRHHRHRVHGFRVEDGGWFRVFNCIGH